MFSFCSVGDEDARKRLLGGEATLSEKNVDATNSLKRFWPRASIVAEQLWSSTERNNTQDALFRFYLHLDRSPMLKLMEH
jgi:N-acetyl-beta-hexosaminidase